MAGWVGLLLVLGGVVEARADDGGVCIELHCYCDGLGQPDSTGSCDSTCEDICGSGSTSASASANNQAERDAEFQDDLQDALRGGEAAREHALRTANQRGIAAYKAKKWSLAMQYFEGALLLDPSNELIAENLRQVREREQVRHAEAALASGPFVYNGTPEEIADRMSGGGAAASPGVFSFLGAAFEFLRDRSFADLKTAVEDELDIMTPMGLFLRVESNVAALPETLSTWILDAASGRMSLKEALSLDLKGSAMILNVGAAAGEFVQSIVEARDGRVGVVEHGQEWVAEHGINSLADGLFGSVSNVGTRALQIAGDLKASIRLWDPFASPSPGDK